MPNFLDWTSSDDTRDIVHIIVQALVEGRLVVLPAETAYHVFASGLKSDAVASLAALEARGKVRSPTLFLRSPQETLDYSPGMSEVASRVVARAWPGPLVLELPVDSPGSLVHQLPAPVQGALLHEKRFVAQRVAAHEAILQAMRLMPGPLVAAAVTAEDGKAICTGKLAGKRLENDISFVIDDGETHYGGFATSVKIEGNACQLLNPGVLDQATLDQLFQLIVMFVCTGNTCRSPMAETMMREVMTQKFPEQMAAPRPQALITSAGLSAFPGGPASSEAMQVMKNRGLSLQRHQSRSVTERSLKYADLILTMTHSHRTAIVDRMPELAGKVRLLSGSSQDISDPFGGPESVYEACAAQIEGYLRYWADQIQETWFPKWEAKLS